MGSEHAGLNPGQRAAVRHDSGPAAVYAGPGSGKTRVVALRAARLAAQGKRLLVTTFTNDATEEMKTRILPAVEKNGAGAAYITTLHAFCLRVLRRQGLKFHLLTDEMQRRGLAEAAGAAELEGGVAAFLSASSYQKNVGMTAGRYTHDGSYEDMEFARAWRAYEQAKVKKDLREFDDLVLDVAALLDTDETLRATLAGEFTHIVVDECQDMNAPQYGIIFALGRDHKNLMLVGDPDQSLYAFRGADTRTFRQFAEHPRTTVYELRANYRSTRAILSFAGSLIRQDTERRELLLIPTRTQGEPVSWQRYPDPDVEALAIGQQILRLAERGAHYRDIAVLYRTNAQSEAFERHFTALEIPFGIRDDGDFYSRKEVRGILAYLNLFAAPPGAGGGPDSHFEGRYADEWLLPLLNIPARKIAPATASQLRNHAEVRGKRIWDILPDFQSQDLRSHRGLRTLTSELRRIEDRLANIADAGEAIRIVRSATDFDGWLRRSEQDARDNDRIQNIQRMQAAAGHYKTIEEYLVAVRRVREESERRKAEQARKRRGRDEVTLGTGHSAKGLEWPFVFAVGWSEDLLPHRKATDIAEERRVAYVIATRAKDLLVVSSIDRWNDTTVAPSRFLTGLQLAAAPSPDLEARVCTAKDREPDAMFGGLFLDA